MLRTAIKLIAGAILLFVAYKAAATYSLFRFADHMRDCLPASGVCRLAEVKAPRQDLEAAMGQALSCARDRQTTVESMFLAIPKTDRTDTTSATDYQGLLEVCKGWAQTSQDGKK